MKHGIAFFILGTILTSCSHDAEKPDGQVSKWHLIEQLADPGDGSGTFQAVESEKTVEYFEDGSITSNGSLCAMYSEIGNGSIGTYNDSTMTIYVDDCNLGPFPLNYEMDGAYLILNYPCIEPCREKYEQVD